MKETPKRFERKYTSQLNIAQITRIVKTNNVCFTKTYEDRFINNIYFDTPNFKNYEDNIIGSATRYKVRIRWYGELFGPVKNAQLEYKIKQGDLGYKLIGRLQPFEFQRESTIHTLLKAINHAQLPKYVSNDFKQLIPTLLNRYKRKYFEGKQHQVRLTIDDDQCFYKIKKYNNTFLQKIKIYDKVIEVKYDLNKEEVANRITSSLPFRLSKNSKYVNGIELLYD